MIENDRFTTFVFFFLIDVKLTIFVGCVVFVEIVQQLVTLSIIFVLRDVHLHERK